MLLTICDARHEGHCHGPRSSIVRSLFSSQEPFGVLSVLANLSRHNTFRDSKCFDLKQKYPRKRILSLLHPKKPTTRQSENEKKAVKTFLFFKVMISEMCIFSPSNGVSAVLVWSGWLQSENSSFCQSRRKRVSCYRWFVQVWLHVRCWQTDLFHTLNNQQQRSRCKTVFDCNSAI